jgi:hypothetical protein
LLTYTWRGGPPASSTVTEYRACVVDTTAVAQLYINNTPAAPAAFLAHTQLSQPNPISIPTEKAVLTALLVPAHVPAVAAHQSVYQELQRIYRSAQRK